MTNDNKDDLLYNAKNGDDSLTNDNHTSEKQRRPTKPTYGNASKPRRPSFRKIVSGYHHQELTDRANSVARRSIFTIKTSAICFSLLGMRLSQYEDIINRIVSDDSIFYTSEPIKGQKWPTLIEAFQFFMTIEILLRPFTES